jgi:hypothetical protein
MVVHGRDGHVQPIPSSDGPARYLQVVIAPAQIARSIAIVMREQLRRCRAGLTGAGGVVWRDLFLTPTAKF